MDEVDAKRKELQKQMHALQDEYEDLMKQRNLAEREEMKAERAARKNQ